MLAVLLVACSPMVPSSLPAQQPAPSPRDIEASVLEGAARARRDAGVPPLTVHERLSRAALGHATELARRGELDHTSEDPAQRTLVHRVRIAGVSSYSRLAENLASVLNPRVEPGEQVIRLWLDSPGHRANLLDGASDRTGVGAALATDGQWYVVQVFGAGLVPASSP